MDIPENNDSTSLTTEFPPEAGMLAYVRPVTTEKGPAYAICASDGTQLAVYNSREAAFYAAKQHDLEPVQIH